MFMHWIKVWVILTWIRRIKLKMQKVKIGLLSHGQEEEIRNGIDS